MGRTSTSRLFCAGLCVVPGVVVWSAAPAHADLRLCNRASCATPLCTSSVRFELADHADCAARGLNANGFAPVELGGGAATVRFRE